MTDDTTTTEHEHDDTELEDHTTDETTEETTAGDGKKGNAEAARWRVKLRETEAERDTLRARVTDMHAAEVSRLATGPGALHDGADLLLTSTLDDLLDDDGNVDAEAVTEAVAALVERKPHLARPAFEGGVGIGEAGATTSTSWADVIKGGAA